MVGRWKGQAHHKMPSVSTTFGKGNTKCWSKCFGSGRERGSRPFCIGTAFPFFESRPEVAGAATRRRAMPVPVGAACWRKPRHQVRDQREINSKPPRILEAAKSGPNRARRSGRRYSTVRSLARGTICTLTRTAARSTCKRRFGGSRSTSPRLAARVAVSSSSGAGSRYFSRFSCAS